MRRKILYSFLLIISLFAFIFVSASCDNSSNNNSNNSSTNSNTSANPDNQVDSCSTANSYCLVQFDSKGGTEVVSQSILKGEKASKPSNPTKEGYTFDDWYYKGERWIFVGYVVTENMTLEANWIINNNNLLLLNTDEYAGTITEGGNYDFDTQVTIEATPNPGYTFDGWYNGDILVEKNSEYTFKMPNENVKLEAKWLAPDGLSDLIIELDENDNLFVTGVRDLNIKKIIVPNIIDGIACGAFKGCSLLESMTIPFIGGKKQASNYTDEYSFKYIFDNYVPSTLKEVIITDSSYIPNRAFKDCTNLTNIKIPSSVTSIGEYAFSGCSKLASIDIPNSVTSIGSGAFSGCSSLTSIDIPNSVTSIGSGAFSGCSSLTSIEIPDSDSVTSIGDSAFSGCSSLASIDIPNSVIKIGNFVFNNCSSLESIEIPNSVRSIGKYAFENCSSLTSIEIPYSVTNIGYGAFSGCSILESISIPFVYQYPFGYIFGTSYYTGSTLIKQYYYDANTSSRKVSEYYIPKTLKNVKLIGLTHIPSNAFSGFKTLASIEIPNSVTSIGEYAFSGCSSLESIEIPNNVTSIGEYAFSGCSSLGSIEIPNNVTSIGEYAFENCSSLTIYYAGTIEDWCKIEFKYRNSNPMSYATNFYIHDEDGECEYNFNKYSLLTKVEIPNGVTSIGEYAFQNCSSLTNIEIPNSVTSIGKYAFENCSSLTNIEIPNSVTNIGYGAFSGCSILESISIPFVGEMAYFKSQIYQYPFGYIFGSSNSNGEMKTVQYYYGRSVAEKNTSTYYIPSTLRKVKITGSTYIPLYAFCNCKMLTNIEISDGITDIGTSAFSGCTSLESIEIPNSVKMIGRYAFYNCSSLKMNSYDNAYYLGNEFNPYLVLVRAINKYILDCNINPNCKIIMDSVFAGCYNLETIKIPFLEIKEEILQYSCIHPFGYLFDRNKYTGSMPIKQIDYLPLSSEITYYIPSSLKRVEITGSTGIPSGEFKNFSSLTSVEIPNSVTSIGVGAFENCSSLTSILIPNSVTSIGINAFRNCSSLQNVYYMGNSEQWNNVQNYSQLPISNVYFYSEEEPIIDGNYWHYVNDEIAIWE